MVFFTSPYHGIHTYQSASPQIYLYLYIGYQEFENHEEASVLNDFSMGYSCHQMILSQLHPVISFTTLTHCIMLMHRILPRRTAVPTDFHAVHLDQVNGWWMEEM